MRFAQGDGVEISHPVFGDEVWLSGGSVAYVVIDCHDGM
jgi:hypothetical protein